MYLAAVMLVAAPASGQMTPAALDGPDTNVRYGATFASAPRTCDVLRAAYAAAALDQLPAGELHVRPASRSLDLRSFVPAFRRALPISRREFDGLAARQELFRATGFIPRCSWIEARGGSGAIPNGASTMFTSPIFSANRRLAMTEVLVVGPGTRLQGFNCTARLQRRHWSARCMVSVTS